MKHRVAKSYLAVAGRGILGPLWESSGTWLDDVTRMSNHVKDIARDIHYLGAGLPLLTRGPVVGNAMQKWGFLHPW